MRTTVWSNCQNSVIYFFSSLVFRIPNPWVCNFGCFLLHIFLVLLKSTFIRCRSLTLFRSYKWKRVPRLCTLSLEVLNFYFQKVKNVLGLVPCPHEILVVFTEDIVIRLKLLLISRKDAGFISWGGGLQPDVEDSSSWMNAVFAVFFAQIAAYF